MTSVIPRDGALPLLTTYGSGLIEATSQTPVVEAPKSNSADAPVEDTAKNETAKHKGEANLPSPIAPPKLDELQKTLRELMKIRIEKPVGQPTAKAPAKSIAKSATSQLANKQNVTPTKPKVFFIGDDWSTQGTWIDRYGRFYGVLCAMGGGGNDFITGYQSGYCNRRGWIGRMQDKSKAGLERPPTSFATGFTG